MKKWIATLVMTVALAAGAFAQQNGTAQQQAAAPKDFAPLQGTWIVSQMNGDAPPGQIALTVSGSKYSVAIEGTVDESGTLNVDASKTPMTLDLIIAEGTDAGQTQLGIFEVKGDSMRCLLAAPGATARPTSFEKADGVVSVVAQKKK